MSEEEDLSEGMETELHDGEDVLERFSPSRTSVLLIDYVSAGLIALIFLGAAVGITRISLIESIVGWTGPAFIAFLGLAIAAPIFARAEIQVRGNTYYVTGERVIHEFKFIKYNSKMIKYSRVTHLKTDRSIVDRIFRTGKVHVKTAGTGGTEMTIKKIKKPLERQQTISRHISSSPQQTGTGNE